jgi:hypothetical protein
MPIRCRPTLALPAAVAVLLSTPTTALAEGGGGGPADPHLLVSGLDGGSGSTIGPDGALYVVEPAAGEVSRIDLGTGKAEVVADCLPDRAIEGVAGAMDVAFIGATMYALTAVVGPDVGGSGTTGVYRVHEGSCDVVADIGQWSIDNPPPPGFDYFVASGVPYAMEPYEGGFLVTDGHLNRVLRVGLDGQIDVVLQLGNVVPTGLDLYWGQVFMAQAGAVPHRPEDGVVVTFSVRCPEPEVIAAGGPLLVDVELGGEALYALAQGDFPEGAEPGAPALPDTGLLLRADGKGGFDVLVEGLDRPTSLEVVHGRAYVVTLDGEVLRYRLHSDHSGGDHSG